MLSSVKPIIWSSFLCFVETYFPVDLCIVTGRYNLILTFTLLCVNDLERSIFTSRFKTVL